VGGNIVKEYWGEGSNRARNWQRYEFEVEEDGGGLAFEEGVDVYIPYAGKLRDNVDTTLRKLRSTMCNCGAGSIEEFRRGAKLTVVSSTSLREGGAHDVIVKESEGATQTP
jgi:IMP dehydrogenase